MSLYIHVPFCANKCPYCDFYSLASNEKLKDAYLERVISLLNLAVFKPDSVYLGGGTPSQLGSKRLARLLRAIQKNPGSTDDAEITLECNPSDVGHLNCGELRSAGYNRVSLGLQSAVDSERRALGRRGTVDEVERAIKCLRRAGFNNISLDIMLGVPEQTVRSLRQTLDFIARTEVEHISAYMLKIEPHTPFSRRSEFIPNEDLQADMYLFVCEHLEKQGFAQYEISNFARYGSESRHNLKYWRCEEYLGLGPGAHSFLNGKRFYYPRDLVSFIKGNEPIDDGDGGDFDEYAMLALRLNEGLREDLVCLRFGYSIPKAVRDAAYSLSKHGLLINDSVGIRLTRKGFLLSNMVIAKLLEPCAFAQAAHIVNTP